MTKERFQLATRVFTFYGYGVVSIKKAENSREISVFSAAHDYDYSGEVNETAPISGIPVTNELRETQTKSITVSHVFIATWLPMHNSNRFNPPDVCAGETVALYKIGNTKDIFWDTHFEEGDLRQNEHYGIMCSNTPAQKEVLTDKNTYWNNIDCIKKMVTMLHTSDNDKELTTHDMTLDTKAGIWQLLDGRGNYIRINSDRQDSALFMHRDINNKAERDHNVVAGRDFYKHCKRNSTFEVLGDQTDTLVGKSRIQVGKTRELTIVDDYTRQIGGEVNTKIVKDNSLSVMKNMKVEIVKDYDTTVYENRTTTIKKVETLTVEEDMDTTVLKNYSLDVTEDMDINTDKNYTLEVTEDKSTSVGKKYSLDVNDTIEIVSASSSVTITGGGAITIQSASSIDLKAPTVSVTGNFQVTGPSTFSPPIATPFTCAQT